jgi:hypothetical protein
LLPLLVLSGCGDEGGPPGAAAQPPAARSKPGPKVSLAEARRGFQTKLVRKEAAKEPVPQPSDRLFRVVRYESPAGKLAAYLSPDLQDGKKHPAVIWVFGGFDNGIGETAWEDAPPSNDQSASAFRKAGIIMMYPSFRGGNDNPGFKEGFYGEVDDVLAAADYLAKQEYVDSTRIYLGGHSTGGTLVLLAAESSDRFRGVFALGPTDDVSGYGPDNLPFDTSNRRELELRAPGRWLDSIRSPVFVFEGTEQPSNLSALGELSHASENPLVHCYAIQGANHFSIIAPLTKLIAQKVLRGDGPTSAIAFTPEERDHLMGK